MVEKAMSWALHALAVREPRVVEDLFGKHESALARSAEILNAPARLSLKA
jgi:hypothetical protein